MKAEQHETGGVYAVIASVPYFMIRIDVEAWQTIMASIPPDAIPDWIMVEQIAEVSKIVMRDGTPSSAENWVVVATPIPNWWIDMATSLARTKAKLAAEGRL